MPVSPALAGKLLKERVKSKGDARKTQVFRALTAGYGRCDRTAVLD